MHIKSILEWVYTAKPELRKRTIADITHKDITLIRDVVDEEISEGVDAILRMDKEGFKDAIVDSIWMILNLAAMGGLTSEEIEEYAKKVQESNDSKFCTNEADAVQCVFLYGMGQHPDKMLQSIDTFFKKITEDRYVILRKSDNKIMKSHLYKSLN